MSLRAIARGVGVSHAALYHHFPDRDALLAAVAAEGFVALRQAMLDRAQSSDGPPLTRLQEAGVAYVLFAWGHPNLYRLMFSGLIADRDSYPELQSSADAAYTALGQLLSRTRGKSHGKGEPMADHPASRAAWATVHGLAMLLIDGRIGAGVTTRRAVETVTREVTTVLGRGWRGRG